MPVGSFQYLLPTDGCQAGVSGGLVVLLWTAGGPGSPRSERHSACFRAWCKNFFEWYNGEHYRAGLGDLNSNQPYSAFHAFVLA